jgi:signal transduction histidine kinase
VLGIGSRLRRHWVEAAWVAFSAANVAVILLLSQWETIPFHFVWVSLTLVYGFRVWSVRTTASVLGGVMAVTAAALLWSVSRSDQGPDELAEVPLMAAMFVGMVWHARRRQSAMEETHRLAESQLRLLERQRDFIRDASHELRTPITIARGHAELIRQTAADGQATRDADVVLDELNRLSRISERLLILAAAEHPDFIKPAPLSLRPLIEEIGRRWSVTAPRVWEAESAEGSLMADRERLQFALDALIENAVKFTSDGDRIAIRGWLEDHRAMIEVADTGTGIPAGKEERIFDRFARIDEARDRSRGGTGLGLAIVRAVVEAHGGTVSVNSNPGKGSAFRLTIPGALARTAPGQATARSRLPAG